MKENSVLKKYYGKIAREGLLKSVLLALIVALFIDAVVMLVFWLTGIKRIWFAVGIGVGCFIAFVPAAYFLFFRPTAKSMAKRLDSLGLEERLLTMNELQNDDSYIAARQREDAKRSLEKVNPKDIKFVLTKTTAVLLVVSLVCASSMTTVSALAQTGVIPGGNEIIDEITKNEVYYTVKYAGVDYKNQDLSVYETPITVGGMFEGLEEQLIAVGENGEPILAVADPDWVFLCWGDGSEDPYRVEEAVVVDDAVFDELEEMPLAKDDTSVKRVLDLDRGWAISKDANGNITITVFALFAELEEGSGGEGGDGMGEDESGEQDAPQESPSEDSDSDKDPSDSEDSEKGDDGSDSPGSSNSNQNNNIIDGDTDYKTRLEEYIAQAEEYKKNGQEVPPYLWELIQQYYELLK